MRPVTSGPGRTGLRVSSERKLASAVLHLKLLLGSHSKKIGATAPFAKEPCKPSGIPQLQFQVASDQGAHKNRSSILAASSSCQCRVTMYLS